MSHHAFEFIVDHYLADDRFRVVGRNGDEDVKIGDVFDVMYRYKRPKSLADYGFDPVREPGERDINVRVVGIYALSRELEHLGVGMTGALTIEGDGIEDIAPGWVLGRRQASGGAGDPGQVNGEPSRA